MLVGGAKCIQAKSGASDFALFPHVTSVSQLNITCSLDRNCFQKGNQSILQCDVNNITVMLGVLNDTLLVCFNVAYFQKEKTRFQYKRYTLTCSKHIENDIEFIKM